MLKNTIIPPTLSTLPLKTLSIKTYFHTKLFQPIQNHNPTNRTSIYYSNYTYQSPHVQVDVLGMETFTTQNCDVLAERFIQLHQVEVNLIKQSIALWSPTYLEISPVQIMRRSHHITSSIMQLSGTSENLKSNPRNF